MKSDYRSTITALVKEAYWRTRVTYVAAILAVICCLVFWWVGDLFIGIAWAISCVPISLLYGKNTMREFHANDQKYRGWGILTVPVFLWAALVLFGTILFG